MATIPQLLPASPFLCGVVGVGFGMLDPRAVRLSQSMAGTLLVSVDSPLNALFFAISAGIAPPIAVATPQLQPTLEHELESAGSAACVDWPVQPSQCGALRAVFRRRPAVARYYQALELLLDPLSHGARIGETWLHLSPQEFAVLWCLSAHEYSPVSTVALLREAWGRTAEVDLRQSVEYCVSQLRRKLHRAGRGSITTVRRFGYQLVRATT